MLTVVYLEELWGTSKASTSLMEMPHMKGMAVMRFHHPTLIPCIDFTISSGKMVGEESKTILNSLEPQRIGYRRCKL